MNELKPVYIGTPNNERIAAMLARQEVQHEEVQFSGAGADRRNAMGVAPRTV